MPTPCISFFQVCGALRQVRARGVHPVAVRRLPQGVPAGTCHPPPLSAVAFPYVWPLLSAERPSSCCWCSLQCFSSAFLRLRFMKKFTLVSGLPRVCPEPVLHLQRLCWFASGDCGDRTVEQCCNLVARKLTFDSHFPGVRRPRPEPVPP